LEKLNLPRSDEKNKHLETYKIILQLLNNEINLNWQRLNTSLLANSILIATWAVSLMQGNDMLPLKWFLIGISGIGLILSIFWILATITGNAYHNYWIVWLRDLEDELCPKSGHQVLHSIFIKMKDFIRGKKPVKIINSEIQMPRFTMRVKSYFISMAFLFLIIYIGLLVYSLCYFKQPRHDNAMNPFLHW